MSTAENAKLEYESGQQSYTMSTLTDSGDAKIFTSSATLWSNKSGYSPKVMPNGILSGGVVTPAAAAGNNNVDVAAISCNLNGVKSSVSATSNVAITRPATAVAKVNSITIDSAGAITVVAGTDGTNTTFSETRGVAGGPPLIPVTSIEVAQVRVTSNTSAVIQSTEIYSVIGTHTEMANYPVYTINYDAGSVTFASTLPKIHTGTVAKKVYASYAAPIFAQVDLASDFVPPENTHSVASNQVYGTTLGTTSTSINQGSFRAYFTDGVSDGLISQKDQVLWFRFYPDMYKSSYLVCQGKLGVSRTFPAGAEIEASCTISATKVVKEVV